MLGHVRRGEALLDDRQHQLVGDQLARLHDPGDLTSEVGAGGDGLAQHVARRDVGRPVVVGEADGLRALAGALTAEDDETDHFKKPS